MPKYEDLDFLKNEILQIGQEEQVIMEREGKLNVAKLPDEVENIPEPEDAAMEELLDDDLLKDIQDDFNEGLAFDENELNSFDESGSGEDNIEESADSFNGEESLGELEELGLDTALESIEGLEEESILKSADLNGGEKDWDQLKGDVSLDELDTLEELEPEEVEIADLDELSALDESGPEETLPEEIAPEENIPEETTEVEELLPEETTEVEDIPELDELGSLDDLLTAEPEELTVPEVSVASDVDEEDIVSLDDIDDLSPIEEVAPEESGTDEVVESAEELGPLEDISEDSGDEALKELMGGFEDLTVGDEESGAAEGEGDNLLNDLLEGEGGSDMGDLNDLLSGLDSPDEEAAGLDEGLAELAGEFSEITPASTGDFNLEEAMTEEEAPAAEEDEMGLGSLAMPDLDALEEESDTEGEKSEGSIEDILSEIDSQGDDGDIAELDSFSLDNLEDLYSEEGEEGGAAAAEEEILPEVESLPIEEEVGEISTPAEGEELLLTPAQRKQIIFTLSALPKEVEIKLSEVISGDKYKDEELMPLLEALIHNEKLPSIVSIYEAITGDSSLAKVSAVKFTGQEFEERQKSFAYTFQKNIYPIMRTIAAIFVGGFLIVLLGVFVLDPTIKAGSLYGHAKKLVEENRFEESRDKFDEAYEIQPRYKELVNFAELYQEKKRYPLSEEKYLEALENRYKKSVDMQYADMLREAGRFEKAEDIYSKILQGDTRDVNVLLGLARTNLDWSEEVEERLNNAREYYLDVVDINVNNKEAVYSLMDIYIREDNMQKALDVYSHIKNNMKVKKVNPTAYSKLAGYLIDIDELDHVKDILKKAADSQGEHGNYPDLDYQFARYKRYLNVNNEERMHLDNALVKFDIMKQQESERFYSDDYYRKVLARVYNDLGENQNRVSKGDVEAMKNFIKATETDNEYGKPHHNLGNYYLYDAGKTYYDEALKSYLEAEKRGFGNDRQDYNLGWLYHHNEEFQNSYSKVKKLLTKYPDNNNLKFMMGTVLYRMEKYDLSESLLMETYGYYEGMKQIYYPLEMDSKEDRIIVDMLKKICNNLGATYQKKYEQTRKGEYATLANKYYSDSIEYFHKSGDRPFDPDDRTGEGSLRTGYDKYISTEARINLRMVMYPDTAKSEPTLYELFPFNYEDDL